MNSLIKTQINIGDEITCIDMFMQQEYRVKVAGVGTYSNGNCLLLSRDGRYTVGQINNIVRDNTIYLQIRALSWHPSVNELVAYYTRPGYQFQ